MDTRYEVDTHTTDGTPVYRIFDKLAQDTLPARYTDLEQAQDDCDDMNTEWGDS
jgi:hypothetical protein